MDKDLDAVGGYEEGTGTAKVTNGISEVDTSEARGSMEPVTLRVVCLPLKIII